MKTVLLRSPLLTHSGYGVHARQIGKWLLSVKEKYQLDISTELLNWGATHWIMNPDDETRLLVQYSDKGKKFYDITLQLQLPNEWDNSLGMINIGFTAGVEATLVPEKWIDAVNKMTLVVVPSEFTRQAFINTGANPSKILVIPEAYPEEFFSQSPVERLKLELPTSFNFLCVGQITGNNVDNDRKNIPRTLELFAKTFEGKTNVGLIVKTNFGSNSKLDRKHTKATFQEMVEKIGFNGPSVYLLHGPMTTQEMFSLYTDPSIKGFISLTHGEGFGLPLLEAAVTGLPVIATQWSAHTEFLNKGFWLPIQAEIQQVHETRVDNYFRKDAKWAMPNMEVAKARLEKFYTKPDMPRELAKELAETLRVEYSLNFIKNLYTNTIGERFFKNV